MRNLIACGIAIARSSAALLHRRKNAATMLTQFALMLFLVLQAGLVSAIDTPAHADWWGEAGSGDCAGVAKNFGTDYAGAALYSLYHVYCISGSFVGFTGFDGDENPVDAMACGNIEVLPLTECALGTQDCPGDMRSSVNGCVNYAPENCDVCGKKISGQRTVADPFSVTSGNLRETETDFSTAGPDRLTLTRYYNSNMVAFGVLPFSSSSPFLNKNSFSAGRFGFGWRSQYDTYVSANGIPGGSATWFDVVRPDGESVRFAKTSTGSWYITYWNATTYSWSPSTDPRHDVDVKVTEDATHLTWSVADADDTVDTYDSNPEGCSATQCFYVGKLLTRQFRDGYTLTFGYDSSNNNTTITDSLGRQISFTYADGGFVDTFTDTNGNVTHYYYVDRSCMSTPCYEQSITSTDMAMWALQKVTYPDGNSIQYSYDDIRPINRFALTEKIDENNNIYATWTYDDLGRTLSSQNGTTPPPPALPDLTTVSYDDVGNTRTVTNPLGKQTVYDVASVQGQFAVQSINGLASANTSASTVSYTYDSNGFVQTETSGEGREVYYVHNSIGQETSRTEGYGTAQARTINTTWDASFHVPDEIDEPNLKTNFYYYTGGLLQQLVETDTTTQTIPYPTAGQTRTWNYTYYPSGLLNTVEGPFGSGDTITYAYNTNGYVSSVTDQLGHVTTITSWNGFGQPLSSTDPNGVVTNYTYDLRAARLKTITRDPTGINSLTSFQYDNAGQIYIITLPDSSTLTYAYDTAHRLTTVTNNLGQTINYTLNAMGGRTLTQIKFSGRRHRQDAIGVFRRTQPRASGHRSL